MDSRTWIDSEMFFSPHEYTRRFSKFPPPLGVGLAVGLGACSSLAVDSGVCPGPAAGSGVVQVQLLVQVFCFIPLSISVPFQVQMSYFEA